MYKTQYPAAHVLGIIYGAETLSVSGFKHRLNFGAVLQPPIILKTAQHDDHDKYADRKQPRNGVFFFVKKSSRKFMATTSS
jgi:hypothetical protein